MRLHNLYSSSVLGMLRSGEVKQYGTHRTNKKCIQIFTEESHKGDLTINEGYVPVTKQMGLEV